MFHSQLMLALYRAGRQSEALDAFQGLRRTLVEELGVEPSAELRDLHHRILNSDPGLAAPAGSPPPKPSGGVTLVPAQLPAAIRDFAGRGPVVAQVAALVSGGGGGPGRPPLVAVIGSGGVGKTTLAVHAAHQVAEGFPDGQLYIDLRGADPAPRDPSDVLATFLRDLGVPDGSLPRVVEDRAAHYRTVLTGRRVLIVLDNVRDVAQVRPLIPAASGCAVLITSRRKLSGLAGIHCLDLGLLAAAEAATLLEGIIGAERAEAEPEAVAAIVADCAGLPLALRIAGGRLADRPTWPVSAFATRLADRHRRLDELAVSDLAIRASFDTSYAALLETDPAARHRSGADPAKVFRWAALIPAPIFGADEVSALLGRQDTDDVETALEYLVDVHLLTEHGHGRYSYHDLIRAYALERLEHAEPADHRGRALRRLFNWYVDGVEAAARAIGRSTDLLPVLDPEPDTVPTPAFPDQDAAVAWCTRYTDALYAAADAAPGCGRPDFSLRIAVHLMGYAALDMTTDWRGCLERALKLARDEGDARAEAWILHRLGNWYALWERVEAAPTFEQALALHRAVGDSRGELWALVALAGSHTAAGRPELGIEYGKEALARYAASPDPTLRDFEVLALGTTGYACAALEQYEQAVDYYRRSLAHQRPGDRSRNHAIGLDNLGDAYRALGRYDEAVAALEKSLELSVRNSDRRGQADALHTLGRIYRQSGLADRARDCWKRSLDLSQEIDFGPGIVRASADLAALNAG
jgi:tetratricopeptide (TPR) repeat protein